MTEKYVPVPISGIPLPEKPIPHHPVPLRQNINTWYDNPDNALQVSLFIQALTKFQELPFDDQLSYFRIASKSSSI
jgi:tyrosinase